MTVAIMAKTAATYEKLNVQSNEPSYLRGGGPGSRPYDFCSVRLLASSSWPRPQVETSRGDAADAAWIVRGHALDA